MAVATVSMKLYRYEFAYNYGRQSVRFYFRLVELLSRGTTRYYPWGPRTTPDVYAPPLLFFFNSFRVIPGGEPPTQAISDQADLVEVDRRLLVLPGAYWQASFDIDGSSGDTRWCQLKFDFGYSLKLPVQGLPPQLFNRSFQGTWEKAPPAA